ncbi:MAG: hypothetical protein IT464_04530 [Planctomycetes bacterium]|nr:hypothetical protein [Planctomycetota bacterium]
MIRYNPNDNRFLWPDGVYSAHIERAEEKKSSAGNRMIEFTFLCFDRSLGRIRVWEHVVIPKGLWRLKRIAQAVGAMKAFESGRFSPRQYLGAHLLLELNIRRSPGYAPRNVAVEYLPVEEFAGALAV